MELGVLCELDALLDTRLSVVSKLNQEAAISLIEGGEKNPYYSRTSDDLGVLSPLIDTGDYRAAYASRNKDCLKNSRMTAAVFLVRTILKQLEVDSVNSPQVDAITLEVNYYPYVLTTEEIEMMELAMVAHLGELTKIKFVSIPPKLLTTTYIKAKYQVVILYNYVDWLKAHQENVEKMMKIPHVSFIVPRLLYDESSRPTEEDVRGMSQHSIDAFTGTQLLMAEFYELTFMEVAIFCIIPQPPKTTNTTQG